MTGTDPVYPGHRGDENDENLGMDLVDQVATENDVPTRRPLKKWVLVVAGLAVLVIGVIAIVVNLLPTDYVSKVEGASDQVVVQAEVKGGGHAALTTSTKVDAGTLELTDMPVLDPSKTYTLWLIEVDTDRPTRLADVPSDGAAAKEGFTGLEKVASVMVSVESSDATSTTPSSEPLAVLDLPEAK
jgi:hypothetical protein